MLQSSKPRCGLPGALPASDYRARHARPICSPMKHRLCWPLLTSYHGHGTGPQADGANGPMQCATKLLTGPASFVIHPLIVPYRLLFALDICTTALPGARTREELTTSTLAMDAILPPTRYATYLGLPAAGPAARCRHPTDMIVTSAFCGLMRLSSCRSDGSPEKAR
jgi:hypothetical protein